MKKLFTSVIIVFVCVILFILAKGIFLKVVKANDRDDRIKTLPSFSLAILDGGMFNSWDMKNGPLLIVYFHPDCDYCQYEISSIIRNDIQSKGVKVLLVSNALPESVHEFMEQFEAGQNEFCILSDSSLAFSCMFGISVIPVSLIYNKDLELVKFFKGEVSPDVILNSLKDVCQYQEN
ncbi:MAG: redoxin domain-containing protein [Bacteroidales bacterium]|nr:redoxin domain-containing protein [Bacteroidales bacterium]